MQQTQKESRPQTKFVPWVLRLLAVLCLSVAGAWLYLAGVGCGFESKTGGGLGLDLARIVFNPQTLVLTPLKTFTSTATYTNSEGESESGTWTVSQSAGNWIAQSSFNPSQGPQTTISVNAGNASVLYGETYQSTTSRRQSRQLGVSVATASRNNAKQAYLTLEVVNPTLVMDVQSCEITQAGISITGWLRVLDAPPDMVFPFTESVTVQYVFSVCGTIPLTRLDNHTASFAGTVSLCPSADKRMIGCRVEVTAQDQTTLNAIVLMRY